MAMKAHRAALDLHYKMKEVLEGMVACADPKAGSTELAETCKKILPIAGEYSYSSKCTAD